MKHVGASVRASVALGTGIKEVPFCCCRVLCYGFPFVAPPAVSNRNVEGCPRAL